MKFLKKISLIVLFAIIAFYNTPKCDAASASVSLTSSTSKAVVGNYVTYTVKISSSSLLGSLVYKFNYDTSKLTLISGTLNAAPVFSGKEKSATYTFKFKAKASGSATVSFVINEALDWDGNNLSMNKTTSKTISIITQAELEASYSKNNYLSSLSVDGYEISPSFNKNTLEYSLTLENDIRSINISGTKDDSKSSVTGLGEHTLVEGINKIDIIVTAQNGSTRTYILNVTVKELTPIVVDVNGTQYNVVRKKELLTSPNSLYKETTIKINNEDVPAFINEITNVTLVGLSDSEGNINLYSYNNDVFTLYKEFSFNKIIITEEKLSNIPSGYNEVKITINNQEVTAYQKDDSSNFYLIFAKNIENGLINLYQYDSKENTIQLFNEQEKEETDKIKDKNKIYEYIIIGMGIILVATYTYLLVTTLKTGKKREKKIKSNSKIIDKEIKEKDEFTENDIEITNLLEDTSQDIENSDKIEDDVSLEKEKKKRKKRKK